VPGGAGRGTWAGPPRSTGRKILQSIGVVAAWAAVVGLGTFGTFSDPPTPLTGIRDDVPSHRLHPSSTPTDVPTPVGGQASGLPLADPSFR
jgi:hypothetical protein